MSERDINPPLSSHSLDTSQLWRSGSPLGRRGRALLAVWSLFLLAGFALAASLEPDPRGFGTHQRLGLPPCTFLSLFNLPCPSCGMTTCFACFVRGRWIDAARANTAGLILAMLCAVQVPWCWISVRLRRTWLVDQPDMALLWMSVTVVTACLLNWGTRLMLE